MGGFFLPPTSLWAQSMETECLRDTQSSLPITLGPEQSFLMLGGKPMFGLLPMEKVGSPTPPWVARVQLALFPELSDSTTQMTYKWRIILGVPTWLGALTWQL